jgi:hypothetical protein
LFLRQGKEWKNHSKKNERRNGEQFSHQARPIKQNALRLPSGFGSWCRRL